MGLDFINRLNPVQYRFKAQTGKRVVPDPEDPTQTKTEEYKIPAGKRYHGGLLSTEFRQALVDSNVNPDIVGAYISPEAVGQEGYDAIRYVELIAPMIKAIQQLSARVEQLENA